MHSRPDQPPFRHVRAKPALRSGRLGAKKSCRVPSRTRGPPRWLPETLVHRMLERNDLRCLRLQSSPFIGGNSSPRRDEVTARYSTIPRVDTERGDLYILPNTRPPEQRVSGCRTCRGSVSSPPCCSRLFCSGGFWRVHPGSPRGGHRGRCLCRGGCVEMRSRSKTRASDHGETRGAARRALPAPSPGRYISWGTPYLPRVLRPSLSSREGVLACSEDRDNH